MMAYGSLIHYHHDRKQPRCNSLGKQTVVHLHNGILFSDTKETAIKSWKNMEEVCIVSDSNYTIFWQRNNYRISKMFTVCLGFGDTKSQRVDRWFFFFLFFVMILYRWTHDSMHLSKSLELYIKKKTYCVQI